MKKQQRYYDGELPMWGDEIVWRRPGDPRRVRVARTYTVFTVERDVLWAGNIEGEITQSGHPAMFRLVSRAE